METPGLFGSTVAALTEPGYTRTEAGNDSTLTSDLLKSKVLDKDDFLKLLMTQMQHQDPLNPLDNTEFLSQLSQFSQLEQMYNVNENIQDLADSQNSIRNCLLANFIGKTVKIEGSEIYLENQEGVNLNYELMDWAEKVTIKIYDADGHQVKTIQKFDQDSGRHNVYWDGTDDEGQKTEEGKYTFEITASDGDESIWVQPYMINRICEITFSKDEGPLVRVGNQTVPISKILQIMDQTETILKNQL